MSSEALMAVEHACTTRHLVRSFRERGCLCAPGVQSSVSRPNLTALRHHGAGGPRAAGGLAQPSLRGVLSALLRRSTLVPSNARERALSAAPFLVRFELKVQGCR